MLARIETVAAAGVALASAPAIEALASAVGIVGGGVIGPALFGSALSTYHRWREAKLAIGAAPFSLIAGGCAGVFVGANIGAPLGAEAAGAFVLALIGSDFVTSLIGSEGGKRFADWIGERFRRGKDT